MVEWKASLTKPKRQCHSSKWGEWVCGAQSWKEKRLLYESVFVPTGKQILILKMVVRKAFLMKPKQQCHSSQVGEWVYGPNHESKGHYKVNPCLSQLTNEF